MPASNPPSFRRPLLLTCTAALVATLAACGGGDAPDEAEATSDVAAAQPQAAARAKRSAAPAATTTGNVLELGTTIPGYPHKVDVYRPAGATRAIVFLHGNGGTTWSLAYLLGFSRSGLVSERSVIWDWLSANGVMAVLPQGQAAPGSTVPTWSNYIFKSGQDDVGFLKALSATVKSKYGIADVSLAGYSAGGMMSARMWCETTGSYKAMVSVSGPMMSGKGTGATCTPAGPTPYYVMLGAKDTVLPTYNPGLPAPTTEQAAAGLTAGFLVAEYTRHGDRSRSLCAESPLLTNESITSSGYTWNNCGNGMRFMVVKNADHSIPSIEAATGAKLVDSILGFTH